MANILPTELDGLVSIQNGQLQVQDPKPGGNPAVIVPDTAVRVFVNEQQIFKPTPVTALTHVRITLPVKIMPEYTFSIEIDEDGMVGWLTLQVIQPGFLFLLRDTPPAPALKIQAEKRKVPLNLFEEVQTNLVEQFRNRGVVFGLIPEALENAMQNPGIRVCVAQGQQPLTRHDQFEYSYKIPKIKPELKWLQQSEPLPPLPHLQPCQPGQLLVRKIPGEALAPGKDLYGQVLPPVPPERHPLEAQDPTVYIQNNGSEAISHFEGIPSFNGREVRVMAMQKFSEDFNGHKYGSLDFKGSIQINGSAKEHSVIWSTQNIEVVGDVDHAQLEAEENIIVHGHVVRSELSTGGDGAASIRLIPHVTSLLEQLRTVNSVYQKLRDTVPNIRSHPPKVVLINLIKTQYADIISETNRLWTFNKSLKQLHPRKTMVLKVVLSNLMNMEEKEFDDKIFISWIDKLAEFLVDLNNLEQTSSNLYLTYVQGSTLTANGDIYVCGEGCYNSQLVSRQNILIIGNPGYFRDGSLQVAGQLLVRELGSPNASAVTVELEPDSEIKAGLIYPGVALQFGPDVKMHLMEKLQNVRLRMQDSKVIIEPLYPLELPPQQGSQLTTFS